MRRSIGPWCTIALVWVGVGCGATTGPEAIPGSYSLQAIDTLTLPTAIPVTTTCEVLLSPAACAETVRLEVREGTVRLDADSTYLIQTLLRRHLSSGAQTQVTSSLRGLWSLQGSQIALVDTLGTRRTGALFGNLLTIDVVENMNWVYRK
ncbi:MAG: hypothetical protein IH616_21915 [Gemmatimonadales bacterium]|nr:hypothetical protein [Gemmatimonadales bacterium]